MTLLRSLTFLLLFVPLAFPASGWSETILVGPTEDVQYQLQSRLIAANPGDVIELKAGRYEFRGELNLACPHVTIRGQGLDKTILSFRGQQAGSDGLVVSSDGFLIEDLAIEDTAGNAIKVLASHGVTFRRVRTEWTDGPKSTNGAYGIYPVQCTDVLIERCIAKAAADAGIYVGQCERVIVRGCHAEINVVGIEIENTRQADVLENTATNNSGGILVVDLPGLPAGNGGGIRVFRNRAHRNNLPNFAPKGNIVADVPAGAGLMLLAANDVEVFDNDLIDHETANVLIVSFMVAGRTVRDPKYDPYSEGISIHDNRIRDGGTRPGGKLGELVSPLVGGKFADVVTDGMEDVSKHVGGRLPDAKSIRLSANGDLSFLNFNLAKLTPGNILSGKYRFDRDAAALAGQLPPLAAVELKAAPPSSQSNPAVAVYRSAPQFLSEWKLFTLEQGKLRPATDVISYELNTQLFSDYATKHRVIRLPKGRPIQYRAEGSLDFPVGTVIAKTFAMPADRRQSGQAERLLETRIQTRLESGWYGFSYLWNSDQLDATLSLGGGMSEISWTHEDGQARTNRYEIPNANQCLSCHSRDGVFVPLGPTAANLNRPGVAGDDRVNQLANWQSQGLLEGLPTMESRPRLPQFDDPLTGTVAERARAWLDVNCAHCHQPLGSARSTGLDLRAEQSDPARYGVLKTPVAAGRGSGGRKYDVVPGHPDDSILMFRLESTQPGIRMPNLSRNLQSTEGVRLIREWIQSLPETATP